MVFFGFVLCKDVFVCPAVCSQMIQFQSSSDTMYYKTTHDTNLDDRMLSNYNVR
jgi:cytochrome oxidase Cu insertion factor (SCO1/SenC/PrrC family)